MSEERLRPARLEKGKAPGFGPRFPWKRVTALAVLIGGVGGWYWYDQHQEAERLRASIHSAYEKEVEPAAARIRNFRDQINEWVAEAADRPPAEDWADPRLKLSKLHDAQGLYLRIQADKASSPASIRKAASKMTPDAIPRCLGISPISLRGLYEKGQFLEPEWLERVRKASGVMRLRVLKDEIHRHVRRDLPMMLNMLRSDYFLLVLQHGETRSKHPVDVYLWDLEQDEMLLRARTEAEGLLLPVRIRMGNPPEAPGKVGVRSPGAADCSIAAQIKEVTGEPAMGVGGQAASALQRARSKQGGADAGPGDAGGPDGGATGGGRQGETSNDAAAP
jgi:hypothetical protein